MKKERHCRSFFAPSGANDVGFFPGLGRGDIALGIAKDAVANTLVILSKTPFFQIFLSLGRSKVSAQRLIQQEATPRDAAAFMRLPITRLPSLSQL